MVETCRVGGVDMPYQGAPAAVLVAGKEWQELRAGEVSESGGSVHLQGEAAGILWRLRYERTGPGMVTKSLVVESRADVLLQRVAPAVFTSTPRPQSHLPVCRILPLSFAAATRGCFCRWTSLTRASPRKPGWRGSLIRPSNRCSGPGTRLPFSHHRCHAALGRTPLRS